MNVNTNNHFDALNHDRGCRAEVYSSTVKGKVFALIKRVKNNLQVIQPYTDIASVHRVSIVICLSYYGEEPEIGNHILPTRIWDKSATRRRISFVSHQVLAWCVHRLLTESFKHKIFTVLAVTLKQLDLNSYL